MMSRRPRLRSLIAPAVLAAGLILVPSAAAQPVQAQPLVELPAAPIAADPFAALSEHELVQRLQHDLAEASARIPATPDEAVRQAEEVLRASIASELHDAAQQAEKMVTESALPVPVPGAETPATSGTGTPFNNEPLTNPEPLGIDNLEPQHVVAAHNYWWKNDPVSKVMAGKPFANYVLHRVEGSWFDAPRIPEESNQQLAQGKSLYGPGTPIFVGNDALCTLTVAGTDSSGRKVGITAGHCGEVGEPVTSADSWQAGPSGTVVHRNEALDYSVIEFGSNAEVTNSYNGVTVTEVGGAPQPGDVVCKQGVATNHTCGATLTTTPQMNVNHVCSMVGDSGAPVMQGGRAVGMVNGGMMPRPYSFECVTPWQGALHAPVASARMDAVMNDINLAGAPGSGFTLPEN